ncbi:MAG: diguanylate cyclase, partial [Actinobacteria bacterium]|nr:diguanylate cyclase [Actinomycetota bacterium]
LCVALVAIDDLTGFTASHSQDETDALLKHAATEWRSSLRATDLLARYLPEEFAVVLPGCDVEQAVEVIDRLCGATPDRQNCCAGVTLWDGQETTQTLLGRAEATLHEAQAPGADRVTIQLPPVPVSTPA